MFFYLIINCISIFFPFYLTENYSIPLFNINQFENFKNEYLFLGIPNDYDIILDENFYLKYFSSVSHIFNQ